MNALILNSIAVICIPSTRPVCSCH